MKVSELEGALLDAWVVKALGAYRGPYQLVKDGRPEKNCLIFPDGVPFRATTGNLMPSSEWSHGGPIIERERIRLNHRGAGIPWAAQMFPSNPGFPVYGYGETPLIAAMRCYVASKYGEEVPNE